MYEDTRRRLTRAGATILQRRVDRVCAVDGRVHMWVDGQVWQATRMFDNRPPPMDQVCSNGLLQSFFGYRVRTSESVFDPSVMGFMDFSVPQDQHTQFVYTLPEDEHTALLNSPVSVPMHSRSWTGTQRLDDYIRQQYGEYQVLNEERGVIPMAKDPIVIDDIPGVVCLGTRAGAVKPSTGYAFEAMYDHASSIGMTSLCRS